MKKLLVGLLLTFVSLNAHALNKYIDVVTNSTTGKAIRGATVEVQNYPGLTAATIYSDDGSTVDADSTVSTDADGQYQFYAAAGRYTLVIRHAGATVKTVEDVQIGTLFYPITTAETAAGLDADDIIQPSYPPMNAARYGLICRDTTDAGPAFNKAFDVLRETQASLNASAPDAVHGHVTAPSGLTCYISTTINATGIEASGWKFSLPGTVLIGKTTGKPVVDMLSSRFGEVSDLTIYGDPNNEPRIGVQFGRIDTTSAGEWTFHNWFINGHFSLAGIYNNAAEVVNASGIAVYNYDSNAAAYAAIFDGMNSLAVASDYQTITLAANTATSFTVNHWNGTDFRRASGGPAVYLNRINDSSFEGYWITSNGPVAVMQYQTSSTLMKNLSFNLHYETTSTAPGAESCMEFRGLATPAIRGFRFHTQDPQVTGQVFKAGAGVTTVRLSGVDMALSLDTTPPSNGVFDTASKFEIRSGRVFVSDAALWNRPSVFRGTFGSEAESTFDLRLPAHGTFTPVADFTTHGDFNPTYTTQVGTYKRIGPLVWIQINLKFTANAYAAAAGSFIVTGLPFTSENTGVVNGLAVVRHANINTAAGTPFIGATIGGGVTQLAFSQSGDNVAYAALNTGSIAAGAANVELLISGFYIVGPDV